MSHLVFQSDIEARVHDEHVVRLCEIDAYCTSSHGQQENGRGGIVLCTYDKI